MTSRILYLDFLKGVSIFFVVLLHVAALSLSVSPVGSYSWEIANIIDSLCRFVVPVFVMISGALLMDNLKDFYLYKSLKRLFLPLILWSFFYAFVVIVYQFRNISLDSISAFLKLMFLTPTHNWFLFMLIGIYLLIPLVKAITKDRKDNYFIILWGIFSVLIPFLKNFELFIPFENYLSRFSITMPLGYIGFFILGNKLHSINIVLNRYTNLLLISMSIILIVINTIGTHIMSVKLGHTSEIFYNYLSPTVVIYSICVFILTKTYIINNNYNFSNQFRKIITLMSKYSLAIYMFHVFILILIQKFGINPSICNPLISIPIITIVIYIISFLTIHLCSKISYFKKYMM